MRLTQRMPNPPSEAVPAPALASASASVLPSVATVRHFRQILLWPLQIEQQAHTRAAREQAWAKPWGVLEREGCPWRRLECEPATDPIESKERQYKEFVTFLPYVQRFLYGESRSPRQQGTDPPSDAPMQVFRRQDVSVLRIVLRPGEAPIALQVDRVDLHFFVDIDVVVLKVEVHAEDLPWDTTLDLLHRHGRAYPSGWDASGQGVHNAHRTEWLASDGTVLAASDSWDRQKYIDFVCERRSPRIAAHWAFLLHPLVPAHGDKAGSLRYRVLEYHRMPVMAYLALDDPRSLGREDFVRLGLINTFRPGDALPRRDPAVARFESRYCDDRYWTDTDTGPNTRLICTGSTLVAVGEAHSPYFGDEIRGVLSQFRHQFLLLFLIAHFHRAALLVFEDKLVDAVNDLDIGDSRSQLRFRQRIRDNFESFLRFTHRYWFHELSERAQVQGLFARCATHLGNDAKYREVSDGMRDMSQYLDSDTQRRQSSTVVRLTVVTTFGLVATTATGFLGMNLIDETASPLPAKLAYFFVVLGVAAVSILVTVAKSKALSKVLEDLSEDGRILPPLRKLRAVWKRRRT